MKQVLGGYTQVQSGYEQGTRKAKYNRGTSRVRGRQKQGPSNAAPRGGFERILEVKAGYLQCCTTVSIVWVGVGVRGQRIKSSAFRVRELGLRDWF